MDEIDRKILGALLSNGRISFRELGALVNLSSNAAAQRVVHLRTRGIITGFAAQVSPAALGLGLETYIDVKLQPGTSMNSFEKALQNIDLVQEATSLTGAFDVRLRVACKDPLHLGQLIEQLRSIDGVRETSSTVICRALNVNRRYRIAASRG